MFIEISMLIISGLLWTLIGIVVSRCAVAGQSYDMVQGVTSIGSTVLSVVIILLFSLWPATGAGFLITALLCIAGGIANYVNYMLTGHAMKYGHNGLIWAIMQSSMVSSFIMGALLFGDNITLPRAAGAVFLLLGVFLMGAARSSGAIPSKVPRRKWLIPTLGALLLASTTQCFAALISYFPVLQDTSSVFRSAGISLGIVTGFFAAVPFDSKIRRMPSKKELSYSIVLLISGALVSYVFFYNALDKLQKYQLTAIGYPVALGVCIAAFMLYSVLFLKEKTSIAGWSGFISCLLGITCLSIPG